MASFNSLCLFVILIAGMRYKSEGRGFDSRWFHCNFYWHNPSGRTRSISCGVEVADAHSWQPYHLHVPTVLKHGSLNLLEPSGPVQTCNGIALPLLFFQGRFSEVTTHWKEYSKTKKCTLETYGGTVTTLLLLTSSRYGVQLSELPLYSCYRNPRHPSDRNHWAILIHWASRNNQGLQLAAHLLYCPTPWLIPCLTHRGKLRPSFTCDPNSVFGQ